MSGNSTQSLLNYVVGTPVSLYLEQLTDVNVPVGSASDGQVLEWNVASHKWIAGTVTSGSGGGATTSSQLSDGASLVKTINSVGVTSNNNVMLDSSHLTDGWFVYSENSQQYNSNE